MKLLTILANKKPASHPVNGFSICALINVWRTVELFLQPSGRIQIL